MSADRIRLFAISNPDDDAQIPAVYEESSGEVADRGVYLLLHGLGIGKNEYLDFYVQLSRRLSAEGFSTLRIDFRGHGESRAPSHQFTVTSSVLDAATALGWLLRSCNFDRIKVFGLSFGASIAILLASLFPARVGALSLLAPVLDYDKLYIHPESTARQQKYRSLLEDVMLLGESRKILDDVTFGGQMVEQLALIPLHDRFVSLDMPVAIMHGTADDAIPFSMSQKACHLCKNAVLHEFPNMEHGFTDAGDAHGIRPQTARNFERILKITTSWP